MAKLLALFKHRSPSLFHSMFGKYGIDVSYSIKYGDISDDAVLHVYSTQSAKMVDGLEAIKYLQNNPELTGAFIAAGQSEAFQKIQVEAATRNYVKAALNIKYNCSIKRLTLLKSDKKTSDKVFHGAQVDTYKKSEEHKKKKEAGQIKEDTLDFKNIKLTDTIKSEKSTAALFDMVIHRWTSEPRRLFQQSITYISNEKSYSSLSEINAIDESAVLKKIAELSKLGYIKNGVQKDYGMIPGRMDKLVKDTSLSTDK